MLLVALVSTNMLFPSLQCQTIRGLAVGISGNTNKTTGQLSLHGVDTGDPCRMRTTESQGNSEPLTVADRDVGPELTGRLQDRQPQQVCRHHNFGVRRMRTFRECRIVFDASAGIGILNHGTEDGVVEFESRVFAENDSQSPLIRLEFAGRRSFEDGSPSTRRTSSHFDVRQHTSSSLRPRLCLRSSSDALATSKPLSSVISV